MITKFAQTLIFSLLVSIQTVAFADLGKGLSAEELTQKGMRALHENHSKEALQFFRQSKAADANFAPAYVGEAQVLMLQNAWDEALALLNRAIQLAPEFGVAYHNRGVLRYYRGENQEAYSDFRQAIKRGETVDQEMLTQTWGAVFPDEMIEKMNVQIEAQPEDADAYLNRGIAHFYKNDFQATQNDWKKAKELGAEPDPKMWQALEKQIQMEKGIKNAVS